MQKLMPLAQFTIILEWCASEAHTRGEFLLRGHGANRVKKDIFKSWIKLQRWESTAIKTLQNLLCICEDLHVLGYEFKKLVALGFPTYFPLKSKS